MPRCSRRKAQSGRSIWSADTRWPRTCPSTRTWTASQSQRQRRTGDRDLPLSESSCERVAPSPQGFSHPQRCGTAGVVQGRSAETEGIAIHAILSPPSGGKAFLDPPRYHPMFVSPHQEVMFREHTYLNAHAVCLAVDHNQCPTDPNSTCGWPLSMAEPAPVMPSTVRSRVLKTRDQSSMDLHRSQRCSVFAADGQHRGQFIAPVVPCVSSAWSPWRVCPG